MLGGAKHVGGGGGARMKLGGCAPPQKIRQWYFLEIDFLVVSNRGE